MNIFEKIMKDMTPEKLAGMMICPGEFDGKAIMCAAKGERCLSCKLQWLSLTVDMENNIEKAEKTKKQKYGSYSNVLLSEEELEKLCKEYGQESTYRAIEYLSEYMAYKRYTVKSHYLAIRKWVFTALKEKDIKEDRIRVEAARTERANIKEQENNDRLSFELDDIFEK